MSEATAGPAGDEAVRRLFANPSAYDGWATRWRERLSKEPQDAAARRAAMLAANPAYIPRNHRVEAVIEAAVQRDDFAPFDELLDGPLQALRGPAGLRALRRPARDA